MGLTATDIHAMVEKAIQDSASEAGPSAKRKIITDVRAADMILGHDDPFEANAEASIADVVTAVIAALDDLVDQKVAEVVARVRGDVDQFRLTS